MDKKKPDGFLKTSVSRILSMIFVLLYAFLFLTNLIGTTKIDMDYNIFCEYAHYDVKISPVICILFIVNAVISFFLYKSGIVEKINERLLKYFTAIAIMIMGLWWVLTTKGYPIADQELVSSISSSFLAGDYSKFNPGAYINRYPFQLGIIFIFECIYRVFGSGNHLSIMILNSVLAAVIFLNLYSFVEQIIGKGKKLNYFSLFFLGCIALPMHSFFVYGNMWGLFFSTSAVRMFCKTLDEKKIFSIRKALYYLTSVLLFAAAIVAKNNCIIFLIGVVLCGTVHIICEKRETSETKEAGIQNGTAGKFINILLCFGLLLSVAGIKPIYAYYENASGMKIPDGIPKNAWIAMGLQEGIPEWGCGANGWYNDYTVSLFEANEFDSSLTKSAAHAYIIERLRYFKNNPGEAVSFYIEKILTQWCEPTFQSFWMIDVWDNHAELSPAVTDMLSGKTMIRISIFMRLFLLFVYFGNALYYLFTVKENDCINCIYSVIALGGFLFHILWEAKAIYILPYMVISTPTALIGLIRLYECAGGVLSRKKKAS